MKMFYCCYKKRQTAFLPMCAAVVAVIKGELFRVNGGCFVVFTQKC